MTDHVQDIFNKTHVQQFKQMGKNCFKDINKSLSTYKVEVSEGIPECWGKCAGING